MLLTAQALFAQASAPAATTQPAAPAPPQDPTVPAIKYERDGRTPSTRFVDLHEQYVARAKEGNVDVLFLGDSITYGWNTNGKEVWKERYAGRNAAKFGIGGDRTQHVLWRIENGELDGIKPKVVVLMIGTNNTNSDEGDEVAQGVTKIVKTVQAKTGAKVLLLGVFPRGADAEKGARWRGRIKRLNEIISKLDDGKSVRYLDLTDKFQNPDGTIAKEIMYDYLHLTPAGYTIWAEAMEPLLSEMLGEPGKPKAATPAAQGATVPTPRLGSDGAMHPPFKTLHEKFLARAKEGNVGLLFVGDSITQAWDDNETWKKRYAKYNPANFGISGDRTQFVLWRIQNGEYDNIRPKVVVLMIGSNNVSMSDPPAEVARAIAQIVQFTRQKLGAKVLLLGVFPRGANAQDGAVHRKDIDTINRTIAKLDDGKNVRYLDLKDKFQQPDGTISTEIMYDALHLTPKGYAVWAEGMQPLLTEMMGE
ncbi:MAG: GDSL-type esterase/lipase family protein [Tepidisphaeraceae bacterium]